MPYDQVESISTPVFAKYGVTDKTVFTPEEFEKLAPAYAGFLQLNAKEAEKTQVDSRVNGLQGRLTLSNLELATIGELPTEPPASFVERQAWVSLTQQRNELQTEQDKVSGELTALTAQQTVLETEIQSLRTGLGV